MSLEKRRGSKSEAWTLQCGEVREVRLSNRTRKAGWTAGRKKPAPPAPQSCGKCAGGKVSSVPKAIDRSGKKRLDDCITRATGTLRGSSDRVSKAHS